MNEQNTEYKEILLYGAEFNIDENKNKETPSNVDINRYILKRSYESYEIFERIIKKYLNEKLYEENYMKNKIGILYKYPIIYGINNNLLYLKIYIFLFMIIIIINSPKIIMLLLNNLKSNLFLKNIT